ncbi:hypothetical protein SASPL_150283 [Salvia splendens]|uniref:Uncharacterized protein n=1 Tax=Salvia splendens TaxID=180675 RepID=A0A8X8Z2Q0_SALSN|nr:hypothetical protein SASPL_150283 [Salvia splendens]
MTMNTVVKSNELHSKLFMAIKAILFPFHSRIREKKYYIDALCSFPFNGCLKIQEHNLGGKRHGDKTRQRPVATTRTVAATSLQRRGGNSNDNGCCGGDELKAPRQIPRRFVDNGLSSSFVEASVDHLDRVRASYDGLIITTNVRRKILKLMNPMTGRYVDLPLGVSCNPQYESFGIAFCSEAKTYKVVHVFPGRFGVDFEILTVETRKWRRIDWPPPLPLRKEETLTLMSAGGSLHLLGSEDCFFSLDVRDEKFVARGMGVRWCSCRVQGGVVCLRLW